MSAAATAAGYLYASGRLRGRAQRDQEDHEQEKAKPARRPIRVDRPQREVVRVAALPPTEEAKPRRTPTIQYRTRRWKPGDEAGGE